MLKIFVCIVTAFIFTCAYFGTYNREMNHFNYKFDNNPNAHIGAVEWLKKMENKYSEEKQTINSVCQKNHENASLSINLKDMMLDTYFKWGY